MPTWDSLGISGRILTGRARLAVGLAVVGVLLAAASAFLFRVEPGSVPFLPPCPFKVITGLSCPGCGSVRALHQLLHGRLVSALDLNALAVLLLPAVAWHLAATAARAFWNLSIWSPLETRRSGRIVLGAVVAFWILRNINCYPLAWLSP